MDFPGRFLTSDPAYYLAKRGLVDLFVMPVDSDRQSMSSALAIITRVFRNEQFIKATGRDREQDVVILLNRETQKERSGRNNRYDSMEKIFGMMNIPVIGCRMREILIARRDADTFGFVRNTLCWPQQNIRKACPYIGKIFDEIIYRAKGEWDETRKEQVYGSPQAKQ